MDAELIERLARQVEAPGEFLGTGWRDETLHRFAALVADECASLCESLDDSECDTGWSKDKYDCAAAIREKFGAKADFTLVNIATPEDPSWVTVNGVKLAK